MSSTKNIHTLFRGLGSFLRFWILLFYLILGLLQAQTSPVQIRTLNSEDGLSSHNISSITQDDLGYLWLGTDDGLNRYDGNTFKVFRNDPSDTTTISDSRVTVVLPAQYHNEHVLWVGTRNGLNRIQMSTGEAKMYLHNPSDPASLSHPIVTALAIDSDGMLWVGTEDGLNILTSSGQTTGRFKHIKLSEDQLPGNPVNFIRSLTNGLGSGSNKNIWAGTRNGLKQIQYYTLDDFRVNSYDFFVPGTTPNENEIRALKLVESDEQIQLYVGTDAGELYALNLLAPTELPRRLWTFDNFIRDIEIDNFDQIWVATYGSGLVKFSDYDSGQPHIQVFTGSPKLRNSLSNSHTVDLFLDASGILWVATDNGLNALLAPALGFEVLGHIPDETNSLAGSEIRSVLTDSRGNLWVGTVSSGLTVVRRDREIFQHYFHDPEQSGSLTSNSIISILEDRLGVMWFGTWDGGLLKLNPDEKTFTSFLHDPEEPNSPPDNVIQGMLEDQDGNFWLNTGNGLSRFDPMSSLFANYFHDSMDSTTISDGDLQSKAMYLDRSNRLWIGSYGGGLNRLDLNDTRNKDPRTARFEHFHHEQDNAQSLSNEMIISLHGSWDGNQEILWAGTFNGGLNRIQMGPGGPGEKLQIKRYTEKEGLCDNVVFGIEEDPFHNLWLSTGAGLANFDPQSETFINYYIEDGLPANSFFWGASHYSDSGEMFFGGTDGLVYFRPELVTSRLKVSPKVSITGLSTVQGPLTTRPKDLNRTIQDFNHDQSPFTIEWALFDFTKTMKNQYRYKIDEVHDDWINAGNKTSATFGNLKGGSYTFRVTGSNHNGVPAREEAQIKLRIKPPFQQTLVFKILVFGIVAFLVYLVIALRTQVIKGANAQLLSLNEELRTLIAEKDKAEQVVNNALREKEVLLREIYHRTKNNMSVIISLLDLQAANINEPHLKVIFGEITGRIYAMSLVHEQLMRTKDLSIINLNTYINQLLDNLFMSYHDLNDRIERHLSVEAIPVSIDTAVPLGLVLNEIVTNSLKYAFPHERHGILKIEARLIDDILSLNVSDDGVGFQPPENPGDRKSLGLSIIHTIVEDQLSGTLKMSTDNGTRYDILIGEIKIVRRV